MGKVKEYFDNQPNSEDEYMSEKELKDAMNDPLDNPWLDIDIKEQKIQSMLEPNELCGCHIHAKEEYDDNCVLCTKPK